MFPSFPQIISGTASCSSGELPHGVIASASNALATDIYKHVHCFITFKLYYANLLSTHFLFNWRLDHITPSVSNSYLTGNVLLDP